MMFRATSSMLLSVILSSNTLLTTYEHSNENYVTATVRERYEISGDKYSIFENLHVLTTVAR